MSHFSFFFSLVACCIHLCLDIFNHWILLCSRWCFILNWYSWCFGLMVFRFCSMLLLLLVIRDALAISPRSVQTYTHIWNTRAQLLVRTYSSLFQQISIHINSSVSVVLFVSFHICYHHIYAYPMSRQTQKTKKNVFDLMFILCVYVIGHCAYVGAIHTGDFFYILFFPSHSIIETLIIYDLFSFFFHSLIEEMIFTLSACAWNTRVSIKANFNNNTSKMFFFLLWKTVSTKTKIKNANSISICPATITKHRFT